MSPSKAIALTPFQAFNSGDVYLGQIVTDASYPLQCFWEQALPITSPVFIRRFTTIMKSTKVIASANEGGETHAALKAKGVFKGDAKSAHESGKELTAKELFKHELKNHEDWLRIVQKMEGVGDWMKEHCDDEMWMVVGYFETVDSHVHTNASASQEVNIQGTVPVGTMAGIPGFDPSLELGGKRFASVTYGVNKEGASIPIVEYRRIKGVKAVIHAQEEPVEKSKIGNFFKGLFSRKSKLSLEKGRKTVDGSNWRGESDTEVNKDDKSSKEAAVIKFEMGSVHEEEMLGSIQKWKVKGYEIRAGSEGETIMQIGPA